MPTEVWIAIAVAPQYQVSSEGRVRRIATAARGRPPGECLRPQIDKTTGYAKVLLWSNGNHMTRAVHRLVCEAFHGPPAPGMDACHNDGDKANNSARNLRWDSRRENNLDAVRQRTNANTAKVACPRGHPLSGFNLYQRDAARGIRKCRACSRARAKQQRAERLGRHVDFNSLADLEFARLAEQAAA